jgi:hypothetical protein
MKPIVRRYFSYILVQVKVTSLYRKWIASKNISSTDRLYVRVSIRHDQQLAGRK